MSAVNKSKEDEGTFSTKVIKIVFIILLLDLLGFTLILPLLPSILDHYAESGVGLLFIYLLEQYNHLKALLKSQQILS